MSNRVDILEENLRCHHYLLIKDATQSTFDSSNNTFKTQNTGLVYRKARLNGVIVAQEPYQDGRCFWLDDGTDTIKVIVSNDILSRKRSYGIKTGSSITVFGPLKAEVDGEVELVCRGLNVEDHPIGEIYHWSKAMQDRPSNSVLRQNNNDMFYSLSSLPSPKRLLDENFLASPIRDFNSQNAAYLWSPNHAYATSTPLQIAAQESNIQRISVKRQTEKEALAEKEGEGDGDGDGDGEDVGYDDDDDDDEFGGLSSFVDIDFDVLEANAIQQTKRKWSMSM